MPYIPYMYNYVNYNVQHCFVFPSSASLLWDVSNLHGLFWASLREPHTYAVNIFCLFMYCFCLI